MAEPGGIFVSIFRFTNVLKKVPKEGGTRSNAGTSALDIFDLWFWVLG